MAKDIVYEHDYREEQRIFTASTFSDKQKRAQQLSVETGIYKAIDERIRLLPHIINPVNKDAYEKCLVMLEKYAARWGGYIKGVVSYETYDAHIFLDLPFHEFSDKHSLNDLTYIAEHARYVCVSTIEDNWVRLTLRFNYFEKIGDVDAIIDEELKKRPELCDALNEAHESEAERILSDPLLVAMIEPQAERNGMTVEEYVYTLDDMIENHPKEFAEWLDKQIKKEHDKKFFEE